MVADRGAEELLRDRIATSFPDDGVLGEEFGEKEGNPKAATRRRWIIDPIDGTIAYSRGIPLYSTIIALVEDGQPVHEEPGLSEAEDANASHALEVLLGEHDLGKERRDRHTRETLRETLVYLAKHRY